jgi:hypothetical protein
MRLVISSILKIDQITMPEISYVPEVPRVPVNHQDVHDPGVPILLPPQVVFSLVETPEQLADFPDPEAVAYEVPVEEAPHRVPAEEGPHGALEEGVLQWVPDPQEDDSSEDEDGYLSEASSVSVDW